MANPILIEDAEVVFRNFAGEEKTFNDPGDRNFCIILDPELADHMKSEGWNIKTLKPRSEEEEPRPYIQVTVNYAKGRPPRVVLRSSRGATDLGADEVSVLDFSNISRWDIMLNPYHWEVKGTGTGVKAYLKTLFATLEEDPLELKYAGLDASEIELNPAIYQEEDAS